MIVQPESFYSTTLPSAITAIATSIPVTVAPNITAGYMVIESSNSNREIIKYTGVTGTTLTGCIRGLATYGSDDSAGTGKSHPAGVEIANKDVHYYYAQYYDFLVGTSATGSNAMRIGDGNTISASNRLWYAQTSSLSAFWGLSSNGQMVVSEDGVTSYVISAGGSGLTAGQNISIIASQINFSMPGMISIWSTSTAPTGWLICDGSSYNGSLASQYADLFGVIGNTYGGASISAFNVPDLRTRVVVGLSAAATAAYCSAMGYTDGVSAHTLTVAEMPAHTHNELAQGAQGYIGGVGSADTGIPRSYTTDGAGAEITGSTGGDGVHQNLQPYITLNYIIKK